MPESDLPLVIVSHTLPDGWLAPLEGQCGIVIGPETAVDAQLTPELQAQLTDAEGLFTLLTARVDDAILDQAPNLRVVSNMAVGTDNIDIAACTRRGIPVGNTPGVLTEATADIAMALLLSIGRRIPQASRDAKEGRWQTWNPEGWLGADLNGATLGIVGMGRIGQATAMRAAAFGLRIVYANRSPRPEIEEQLDAKRLPLEDLLQTSDFVSLHTPLTAETTHLIDEAALRRMKPSAYLINTARGGVVDTGALVKALENGWIAGAGLDVTNPEPLPASHVLYTLPNCLIAPHIGSATVGVRRRMAEIACRNVLAGLAGERLPHCVNAEAIYGSGS